MAYSVVRWPGGSGRDSGLSAGFEEEVSEAGQNVLSEEMGGQTRGILQTDFACACPSVNHGWFFRVLQRPGLFAFLESFLQRVYNENTTAVEHAGQVRGHSDMVRGMRQGCPASVFLFTMALDPIFRWLECEEVEEVKEGVRLEPISFPFCGRSWRRSHLSVRKWQSEKHKSWNLIVEDLCDYVATGRVFDVSVRQEGSMWMVGGAGLITMRRCG